MHFRSEGFGDLFDEGDGGDNIEDIHQLIAHLDHLVNDHDMPIHLVVETVLNIMKPGATEMSHDVLQHFYVAMAAQEQLLVGKSVTTLWLTEFPWGVGFHFGFDRGIDPNAMSAEAKRAIVKSLAAILNASSAIGPIATVTGNDQLRISREGQDDIDVVVTQFRQELDSELGPDAPHEGLPRDGLELRDWLRRWMPDE